jgi:hypothetical protein
VEDREEERKRTPSQTTFPSKPKRLPSLANFSLIFLILLPASLSLIISYFLLAFWSVGVDGRGQGKREGIYGGVAPKGEGLE